MIDLWFPPIVTHHGYLATTNDAGILVPAWLTCACARESEYLPGALAPVQVPLSTRLMYLTYERDGRRVIEGEGGKVFQLRIYY